MRALLQTLLIALASLLLALAGPGAAPGGGGESGVWVLPLASNVACMPLNAAESMRSPRDWRAVAPSSGPLQMKVSADVSAPAAVLYDSGTQLSLPLVVSGNRVLLPVRTEEALLAPTSAGMATGAIVGANGRGYLIRIRRTSATGLIVEIL